jgi:hypothetical protein
MVDPYWIGAQICAVIARVNSSKGKRYTIQDFMPKLVKGKGRQKQSTEEMLALMKAM